MNDLYIESRLQAIKDIASASCSDIKDADNIASFCDEIYDAIPKIDKIVEELELHSFELGTDTIPVHYVRLNEAIEIVKQGGVSDDTDAMCEWKVFDNSLTNEPHWVYETDCGKYVEEEHTSKAFVYCPYCGKKLNEMECD